MVKRIRKLPPLTKEQINDFNTPEPLIPTPAKPEPEPKSSLPSLPPLPPKEKAIAMGFSASPRMYVGIHTAVNEGGYTSISSFMQEIIRLELERRGIKI